MPQHIPQLLKMPHSLLTAFSQPLLPDPAIIIMQLESGNHDLLLIWMSVQHLEMTKHADKQTWFSELNRHMEGSLSLLINHLSIGILQTSCSSFTTLKSVIYERTEISAWVFSPELFMAVQTIPSRTLFLHLPSQWNRQMADVLSSEGMYK